jgi:hypothetical protein
VFRVQGSGLEAEYAFRGSLVFGVQGSGLEAEYAFRGSLVFGVQGSGLEAEGVECFLSPICSA